MQQLSLLTDASHASMAAGGASQQRKQQFGVRLLHVLVQGMLAVMAN